MMMSRMPTPFSSSTAAILRPAKTVGERLIRTERIPGLVLGHDLGALEIKPEADLLEALLPHRVAQLPLVARVEHQEAPAAGADQLAAQGPVRHRVVVPLVDLRVAYPGAPRLLALPVHVHQHRELLEVSRSEEHTSELQSPCNLV